MGNKFNRLEDCLHIAVIVGLALWLCSCSTAPRAEAPAKGFALPPALSEVYRGGALEQLQETDSMDLGMPNQYDRVSHTCVSAPVYNIDGYYIRTDVRCW